MQALTLSMLITVLLIAASVFGMSPENQATSIVAALISIVVVNLGVYRFSTGYVPSTLRPPSE